MALAARTDHPSHGKIVVGIKTHDVDVTARAVEANAGIVVKGPYDDAHERRVVAEDGMGNSLVFYSPLPRQS